MVFGGISRKGSRKPSEDDLAISDPGSDDSWAVLYASKDGSPKKVTAAAGSFKHPTSSFKNSTVSALPTAGERKVDDEQKKNRKSQTPTTQTAKTATPKSQEKIASAKAQAEEGKSQPPTTQTAKTATPKSKEKIASAKAQAEEAELTNSKGQKNPRPLAFTSTPFVRHKKIPPFEVSSIISPIDVTSDGHQDAACQSGDSTTTLFVNRKNPVRPPDETFNQLLDPGSKAQKQNPGIRPLKPVMNQADTTRQYAGGAVKGKSKRLSNLSSTNIESSWETAEEKTVTSDSKNNASNSSKVSLRSSPASSAATFSSKCGNDVGKGICSSNGPNEGNNMNLLNDENRLQPVIVQVQSPCKITRKNSQVSSGDCAPPKTTTKNLMVDVFSNHAEKIADQANRPNKEILTVETVAEPKKSKSCQGISSESQLDSLKQNVTSKISASVGKNNQECPLKEKEHVHVNKAKSVEVKSKTNQSSLKTTQIKEAYVPVSTESPVNLVENMEAKDKVEGNFKEIAQKRLNSKQTQIEDTFGKASAESTDPKDKVDLVQGHQKAKASKGSNKINRKIAEISSAELAKNLPLSSQQQMQDMDSSSQQRVHNTNIEPTVAGQENPAATICQRSSFAVQIGGVCFKQTSCFGFSFGGPQSKTCTKDSIEGMGTIHQACHVVQPDEGEKLQSVTTQSTQKGQVQNSGKSLHSCPTPYDPSFNHNDAEENAVNSPLHGSRRVQASSEGVGTPPKDATDHVAKANEIESSSEEERLLLRAQSLKLRENQGHASRITRSPKILDTGPLGAGIKTTGRNLTFPDTLRSPTTSPRRYLQDGKQMEELAEKNDLHIPINTNVAGSNVNNSEPPQLHSPNNADLHDVSESSHEEFVLLSRNPVQDNKLSDDDNLELEIISSSEDDRLIKPQSPTRQVNQGNSRQSLKGRNISSKVKEIRRRREEKIHELMRSRRDSTDSGSQPTHSYDESLKKGANDEHSGLEIDVRKRIERRCKKVVRGTRNVSSSTMRKNLKGVPRQDSPSEAEEPISWPTERSTSNHNSPNKKLEMRDGLQPRSMDMEETHITRVSDAARLVKSPKMSKRSRRSLEELNLDSDDPASNEPVQPLQIHSRPDEHPVESGLQVRGHTKRKKKMNHESKPAMHNITEEKRQTTSVSKGRQNHVQSSTDHDEEDALGARHSRRRRRPPTMYWLGERVRYKRLENGCQEAVDESLVSSRVNAACRNNGAQSLQAKRPKRKLEKASKTADVKAPKMVKKSKPKSSTQQNGDSTPEEDRMLIYVPNDNLRKDGVQSLNCKENEVQEAKCVWGCGVRGDMLLLGVGAKFNGPKSSQFNQMFYVADGEVTYRFSKEEKSLTAGSFFIAPSGEIYQIENTGNSTVKLVVVSSKA